MDLSHRGAAFDRVEGHLHLRVGHFVMVLVAAAVQLAKMSRSKVFQDISSFSVLLVLIVAQGEGNSWG